MLDKIAKTGKDIILSSGMSNFNELDDVFKFYQITITKYQFYSAQHNIQLIQKILV